MSGKSAATWKAVSTLEWKNKQKAPAEPKGFGAILGEAQDVVVDKWSASGNLVPTYLNRLSEIQLQDEAYIHQQLVKPPEEAKPRRGMHRILSGGKGKSGRGVRFLRPAGQGSRKVRFHEDGHAKTAAASKGTASSSSHLGVYMAAASPVGNKPSGFHKSAAAGAGSLKPSGIRFAAAAGDEHPAAASSNNSADGASGSAADRPAATTAAAGASAPSSQNSTVTNSNTSRSSAEGKSSSTAPSTAGAGSGLASSSSSPAPSGPAAAKQPAVALQLGQPPSRTGSGMGFAGTGSSPTSPPADGGGSSDGGGASGIMALYLHQQLTESAPETPSFAHQLAGGSSSGHWEGALSKTDLVDKQLQRLRTSMAPPPSAAPEQQPNSPLGYRPLSIPVETFERWSVAGNGSSNTAPTSSSGTAAAGGQPGSAAGKEGPRAQMGSRSASRTALDVGNAANPAGGGAAGSAGAGGLRNPSARRLSGTNIPNLHDDQQLLGGMSMLRKSSGSLSLNITSSLTSSSSAHDLLAAAAAAAAAGIGGSEQHTARVTGDSATRSKQRRTTDYLTTLNNIEASIHTSRRTGSTGSPSAASGGASPMQHPSSPRSRSSSSNITTSFSLPGSSTAVAAPVGGMRGPRTTSSSLPDVSEIEVLQLQRSASPLRAGGGGNPALAGPSAGGSGSSGRLSNPRGSRMAADSHSVAAAGGGGGHARTNSSMSASPRSSGSSNGGNEGQQRRGSGNGSAAAAAAAVGVRNGSSKGLHLPQISRSGGKQQVVGLGKR